MTKTWFLCIILGGWLVPLKGADWIIDLVPSDSVNTKSTNGNAEASLDLNRPFYVVLTNTSNHNLRVWKEACSWGYSNLSFEFKGDTEKVISVTKGPMAFTMNVPMAFDVTPGAHFVYAINFSSDRLDNWENVTKLRGRMMVKVIYSNTNEAFPGDKIESQRGEDSDSPSDRAWIQQGWVGRVESKPVEVIIIR